MIRVIVNLLRRGGKFSVVIWLIAFFLSYFWEYFKAFLYHINLSLYFFFGAFLGNNVIVLMTMWIVIFLMIFIIKQIKKVI